MTQEEGRLESREVGPFTIRVVCACGWRDHLEITPGGTQGRLEDYPSVTAHLTKDHPHR